MKTKLSILAPAILAALLVGCGPSQDPAAAPSGSVNSFRGTTAQVATTSHEAFRPLTATVHAADAVTLTTRLPGHLAELHVDLGDTVSAGDPLLTLDAAEFSARVEAARAALSQVERDLQRESALLAQNATTAERVRSLTDARQAAAAGLAEATTMAGYTTLRAPFDGVITARHLEVGDFAAPGTPVLRLESLTAHEVEVWVPATLGLPVIGQTLTVSTPSASAEATVKTRSPSSDPRQRARQTRLTLPSDAPFAPGDRLTVAWPEAARSVTTIPADAVRRVGAVDQVFVLFEGRAELRLVRIGATLGDQVQVHSGLSLGEIIVREPAPALRHGDRLEVRS